MPQYLLNGQNLFVKIDDIIMFRYGELWTFGAPGHCKGSWDDFRGIL